MWREISRHIIVWRRNSEQVSLHTPELGLHSASLSRWAAERDFERGDTNYMDKRWSQFSRCAPHSHSQLMHNKTKYILRTLLKDVTNCSPAFTTNASFEQYLKYCFQTTNQNFPCIQVYLEVLADKPQCI